MLSPTKENVNSKSAFARFVAFKAYEKVCRVVVRVLFDDKDVGYLTDGAWLTHLATEKLATKAKPFEGQGWK